MLESIAQAKNMANKILALHRMSDDINEPLPQSRLGLSLELARWVSETTLTSMDMSDIQPGDTIHFTGNEHVVPVSIDESGELVFAEPRAILADFVSDIKEEVEVEESPEIALAREIKLLATSPALAPSLGRDILSKEIHSKVFRLGVALANTILEADKGKEYVGGDLKYGRLFTSDDVASILEHCWKKYQAIGDYKFSARRAIEDLEAAGELKFPTDEPLFLLRGQDKLSMSTILAYYKRTFEHSDGDHSSGVRHSADAFYEFAAEHPERMKDAD